MLTRKLTLITALFAIITLGNTAGCGGDNGAASGSNGLFAIESEQMTLTDYSPGVRFHLDVLQDVNVQYVIVTFPASKDKTDDEKPHQMTFSFKDNATFVVGETLSVPGDNRGFYVQKGEWKIRVVGQVGLATPRPFDATLTSKL